jgi:hypothetical protein
VRIHSHTGFLFVMKTEVKGHLRKLGQSGRIILKWRSVCQMHSSGSEQGKVVVFVNRVVDLWVS